MESEILLRTLTCDFYYVFYKKSRRDDRIQTGVSTPGSESYKNKAPKVRQREKH